jgi:methylmalonyl-CoA/ethylmalonyl-CoA epimerase
MKFHHIGIIVKNLKNYKSNFEYLLNAKKFSKKYIDKIWNVEIIFVTSKEGILYELISPLNKKSIILNQVKNKSNIINHLAFKTKNIENEKKRLVKTGALPITEPKPAVAFKGKKVQFFYTKYNFIYEIIED